MADHMIVTYREKAEKWIKQVCVRGLDLFDCSLKDCS